MAKPKARTEGLVVEPVDDGVFVVDEQRKTAHFLQAPTACVWTHANGERTSEELGALLHATLGAERAPDMLRLSLDVLERAHLLDDATAPSARLDGISRRQLLAAVGITTAALLTSISLPAQAQVVSGE